MIQLIFVFKNLTIRKEMLSVLSLNFKHLKISSYAVHMVSFENFVKLVSPSLSELKVTPSFCFAFKIPDDPTATSTQGYNIK